MKIPESFKRAQRKTFQDKLMLYRPAVKRMGSLGSITIGPSDTIAGQFMVNFQLLSDAVLAKEWGLVAAQDAVVTCSDSLPIMPDDFVQYLDKVYKVVGKPDMDSHSELMLKLTTEKVIAWPLK